MNDQPFPDVRPPLGLETFSTRTPTVLWRGWASPALRDPGAAGSAPVLLLLHGTGGSRISWRPVSDALTSTHEAGALPWHILAPDLPGHGQTCCTGHTRHGLREMAQDLAALLESLQIRQVALVAGHSAGAAVGLWLSHLSEVHSPGTVSQVLGIAPSLVPPPAIYNLLLGPILAPLFASRASVLGMTALARRSGLIDQLIASTGSTIAEQQRVDYRALFSHSAHIQGAMDFMAATDLPALLDRAPTLQSALTLLIAEDDRWIPSVPLQRIIDAHYPRASVVRCTGGHLVQEARPTLVADLITTLHPGPVTAGPVSAHGDTPSPRHP